MDAASLRDFDERSAAVGEALWPATVLLGGVELAAAVVRPRQAVLLGDYSDEPEPVTLTVRIRKDVLPAAPAQHALLTWSSQQWKIRSITGQEDSAASWTLACQPSP